MVLLKIPEERVPKYISRGAIMKMNRTISVSAAEGDKDFPEKPDIIVFNFKQKFNFTMLLHKIRSSRECSSANVFIRCKIGGVSDRSNKNVSVPCRAATDTES